MRYKVIDYVSKREKVKESTCGCCFHVRSAEQGYIILQDEKEREKVVDLYEWECRLCKEIRIDNVIDFSDWLWKQEVDEIPTELSKRFEWLYYIVLEYKKEKGGILCVGGLKMTNEELQQKIKRLEEQLTEVRIALLESKVEKKPYKVEVPEDIGDYYFVSELGAITLLKDVFFSAGYEKVYLRGLAFKTREEAEQFDKERIIINKFKNWAKKYNGGWTPNWNDLEEEKYTIRYDYEYNRLETFYSYSYKEFSKLPCFISDDTAEQFIEEFGEEIKEVLC